MDTKQVFGATDSLPEKPPTGGQKHILLVEDQAEVRKVMEKLLHSIGYRVTVAVSGDAAWEALREIERMPVTSVVAVGTERLEVVPSPICPLLFWPQQRMVPSESAAQLVRPPANRAVTSVSPVTSTGDDWVAVEP